jgi:hypothetical protein
LQPKIRSVFKENYEKYSNRQARYYLNSAIAKKAGKNVHCGIDLFLIFSMTLAIAIFPIFQKNNF